MREVLAELETTGVLPSDRVVAVPAPVAEPVGEAPAAACAGGVGRGSAAGGASPATYEQELRQAEAASRAAMEQAARRAADIEQREEALRQRERELAEQRRILAEEYRLLRVQRAAAAPPTGVPRAGMPVQPAGARATSRQSRPRVLGLAEARRHGGSHRAIEGN